MYGRSSARSGSMTRAPVNAGSGRSSRRQTIGVRRSVAIRYGRSGWASRSAWSRRRRSWSSRLTWSSFERRSGSSRSETTPTTREASIDVDHRLPVLGRDPNGRVLPRRRGAADQQRQVEPAALHLLGDALHLAERGRDEPRAADDVAALGRRGVQEHVGRDHHAEIDDLVVVAPEHHAHDVLADVVHVALDRAQDHLALGAHALGAEPELLLLHERLEVGDRALHRPRALDDLRQEHLPGAEQVADDLHPGHQRALDHVQRPFAGRAGLLGVLLDELVDPVHERVLEALLDGGLAPREVELLLHGAALDGLGERDHALGRVGPPVEDDVLDVFEQVRRDVLVKRDLSRVHDRHVEAGGDRVVQERRVDRLAHGVVPAEAEREVRDAARDLDARAAAP